MKIYADNAATTRVSDTALAAMTPCFRKQKQAYYTETLEQME